MPVRARVLFICYIHGYIPGGHGGGPCACCRGHPLTHLIARP